MRHSRSFNEIRPGSVLRPMLLACLVVATACKPASSTPSPESREQTPRSKADASEASKSALDPTSVPTQAEAFAAGDFSTCLVCHGAYANGNPSVGGPALTGLPAWYLRDQLKAFRNGWRGAHPKDQAGHVMHSVARLMDDKAIDGAVKYVSAIEIKPPSWRAPSTSGSVGSVETGRALYAERCASCHGEKAEGNEALRAPPLASMDAWYLDEQMTKYAAHTRGYHADDKYGIQMVAFAKALPASAVADVAAFLANVAE